MESKKGVEDQKVDFRGPEESKNLKKSSKTKCFIVLVIAAVLLVSASIALAVVFLTKPDASKNLVDVNLEEGDTLMYRVDQRFEVNGRDLQKETITSIAGIRVVSKTTDAYWFLLKINTTIKVEKDEKAVFGYFRVRLARTKTSSDKQTVNEAIEPYELHGYPKTDGEFVRYMHGLLYQLLPAVRRDLYEDVDGHTDHKLKAENSSSLPGPVMMHRQADTKQNGKVLINNHFNRSDLVNASSDIDLDVKYTDSSAINKSNGMISESNVHILEQLHFGEPMKTKDGRDITMMNVSLFSHVIRIEMDRYFFVEEEIKGIKTHMFVKLVLPNTENIKVTRTTPTPPPMPRSSNSSSSNVSEDGHRLSTQPPTTAILGRNRRAADMKVAHKRRVRRAIDPRLRNALRGMDLTVPIQKTFTLFEKSVIGINIKGESTFSLEVQVRGQSWTLGGELSLNVGGHSLPLYSVEKTNQEIEEEDGADKRRSWSKGIPLCFNILIILLCAQFSVSISITIPTAEFLTDEASINPLKLAVKFAPSADVTGSIEASATVLAVSGGVYVDGTIVRTTFPVKLSYNSVQPVSRKWCLEANAELTALEISAGLFYQYWWFWRGWSDRHTLEDFGSWAAIQNNWRMFQTCF